MYPAESAVYAIDARPTSQLGGEDASRRIRWDEQQNLTRGYFLSRTACQLLVVEPRDTQAGLRVVESDDQQPPRVTNELGVLVERLLVCDSQGQLFAGVNLPVGSTTTLRAADLSQEQLQWRAVLKAQRLVYPEGFDPTRLDNVSGIFGIRPSSRFGMTTPKMSTSILEQSLSSAAGSSFSGMRPRSYVVLASRPPLVSLGVESAKEVAGFHVIAGSW